MTASESPTAVDSHRDSFKTELAALIHQVQANKVKLEGAYDVRSADEDSPDYTIEISEVVR